MRGAGCGERKCVVNWDDHLSVFFKVHDSGVVSEMMLWMSGLNDLMVGMTEWIFYDTNFTALYTLFGRYTKSCLFVVCCY